MANRSKGKMGTLGEDLDAADRDERSASGAPGAVLGEGESVGPWSDEEEEANAFDAASDQEHEDADEDSDEDADDDEGEDLETETGYQAALAEEVTGDESPVDPPSSPPSPKRRRSH